MLYDKIKELFYRNTQNDSYKTHILKSLLKIFSSGYEQILASIISAIIFAVMISKNYYGVFFYITIVVYLITSVLSLWAHNINGEQISLLKKYKQATSAMNNLLRYYAVEYQQIAKKNTNERNTNSKINNLLSVTNFQKASFAVCEHLRSFLSTKTGHDDIYITIYQQEIIDNKPICRMIAYSCPYEPSNYGKMYEIGEYTENDLTTVEFFRYLFSMQKKELTCLATNEQIVSNFKKNETRSKNTEYREDILQQYIGVPITIAKQGVVFLLQVDTVTKDLFGTNEKELKEFASSAIYPFAQFLHMMYEQQRAFNA